MKKFRLVWTTETRFVIHEEIYGGASDIDSLTSRKVLWEDYLEQVPALDFFTENNIVTEEMLEDMIPEGISNICDDLEIQVWEKDYWNFVSCLI